jgi:high-affinity nickel permease
MDWFFNIPIRYVFYVFIIWSVAVFISLSLCKAAARGDRQQ